MYGLVIIKCTESDPSYHLLRYDRVTTCLEITDYRPSNGLTSGAERRSCFIWEGIFSDFNSEPQFPGKDQPQ